MNFKYRIKKFKDDEGEFSEYVPTNKDTILNIIQTHWINESSPNGLDIISITNDMGQHLLIGQHLVLEHFVTHTFDVYYLPQEPSYHFYKECTIETILKSVELFFECEFNEFENMLIKTKKYNSYIRGKYFFNDHNYKYSEKQGLIEGLWLIPALPIGLAIISIGIFALLEPPMFSKIFGVLFIFGGLYYWLPGLLLHFQYKKDNFGISIRVSKGNEKIVINQYGTVYEFHKNEILHVVKFENPTFRNPWRGYGYLRIEFKSGQLVNFTNLIGNHFLIFEKLSKENIETRTKTKNIPRLYKKTYL